MQPDARVDFEGNDLAAGTFDIVERLRPHATTILFAIVATFAALAAWTLISGQQAAGKAQSWEACLGALSSGDVEGFNEVIRRYPGTPAANWSQLVIADTALTEGCDLLFTSRERAEARLQEAAGRYTDLLGGRPTGMLAERAVFGLAKAREALGQFDDARRGYEAVVADYPSGTMAAAAAARVAALSRESTREWYAWFAAQKLTPPPETTPPSSSATPILDATPVPNAPAGSPAQPGPAPAGPAGK
jgi:hypothetical protein